MKCDYKVTYVARQLAMAYIIYQANQAPHSGVSPAYMAGYDFSLRWADAPLHGLANTTGCYLLAVSHHAP